MSKQGLSADDAAALYRRYGALLVHRSRLLLRDPGLAEDAVHELVAILLERGGSVRDAKAPYRFLCRALDRACIDLLRRRKRVTAALSLDDVDVLGPAPGIDADARRAVLDSLASLDDGEQAIAIAAFVDGCTQEEIAAELGLSRVTVNKRVQRIKERLRIRLAPRETEPIEETS